MNNKTEKTAFMCPFYKWEHFGLIYCEGALLHFGDRAERDELVDGFCAHYDDWRKCTIAKNLFKKYERQEKDNGKK
ncbi:MAG: hypothetical protein IKM67_03670 [Clostridia bacterium]|nr:hypothetical protein [Clostridia bacterium]MBR2472834.1 hypothetical protein [Clostridia bacterium]MBR3865796.1 hypothetical protein [Clostridia bacterium]